ncbi:MAG: NAD-dependent epimerase/dehydratase family protein, partial [Mycobacterium leprae]
VDSGVQRVVYAASSSAYGNTNALVKVESLQPKPISPYAVSKLAGEYLLQAFSACYGIETVGLRYFNVFGERQDPDSAYSGVIAKFSKSMLQGIQPTIFGDGTTARDFTYVANAVQANLLAATMPFEANGAIFNVACGHSTTLNDLVHHINAFLGTHLVPNYAPNRPGDVQYSCADITLARETFGYEPEADFVSGLRKTLEWYRSTLDRADESQVNLA